MEISKEELYYKTFENEYVQNIQMSALTSCIFTNCRIDNVRFSQLTTCAFNNCVLTCAEYSYMQVHMRNCDFTHCGQYIHTCNGMIDIRRTQRICVDERHSPFPWCDREIMRCFLAGQLRLVYGMELVSVISDKKLCWNEIFERLTEAAKEEISLILEPYIHESMPYQLYGELSHRKSMRETC